jgi:large subunit ribosomal protein L29
MALKDAELRPLEAAQLRELEVGELKEELERLKEAQFRLKFRSATETIDNPLQFRVMRRNIARMITILRERTEQ